MLETLGYFPIFLLILIVVVIVIRGWISFRLLKSKRHGVDWDVSIGCWHEKGN